MKEQPYKLLNNFYKDKGEKSTIPSLQYIAGLMTIKDVVKYMKMYGRDSDKFRMDILGEFPKYSGEYLASREDIDACKQITPNIIGNDAQFGIDVATGNAEAKTAFAYRNGNSLLNAIVSDAHSPDQIIQDFKKFATECSLPKLDLKKIPIVVDRDGIGYALFERMKDNGFNIDGFHGNQTPIDFHNQERFANRRTEAFFELADKIRTHTAFLINHLALYVLQSISYGVDRGGKIILQPKKEIIIPSKELYLLDVIDAISYAFAPTHKKGSVLGYGKRFVDDTLKFWRGY